MVAMLEYLTPAPAFEPEAIDSMARAFDEACNDLRVFAGDEQGRRIIATRIIDLSRAGVADAGALRQRVVAEARLSC